MGNRAVTAMGTTSNTHHIAIQMVMPKSINASLLNPSGGSMNWNKTKTKGPSNLNMNNFSFCTANIYSFKNLTAISPTFNM